jgi:hypothetical protein
MPSPRQIFEDNIRPAHLLLRVYRLFDTDDKLLSEGDMVDALRKVVGTDAKEDLMLIYNEVFLGLVREKAQITHSTLKRVSLAHLLRQSVVASCTGLDTYLPTVLGVNLPVVIRAKGRGFIPISDGEIMDYFKELNFSLDETLRLINETQRAGNDSYAADFVSTKILSLTKFKYLSNAKGIQVVGKLLGLENPWDMLSSQLSREKKELKSTLNDTVERRNDIVHRADRNKDNPLADPQEITYAWALQAVDTVQHICLALDELIANKIKEFEEVVKNQS